jgi:hypothetical protein
MRIEVQYTVLAALIMFFFVAILTSTNDRFEESRNAYGSCVTDGLSSAECYKHNIGG